MRSIHHSIPIAIAVKSASGNTAANSGGQSFSTPRFENSRPSRKNDSPIIVPAKMRKPTPPWRRWKCANGSASTIITSTASG